MIYYEKQFIRMVVVVATIAALALSYIKCF